MTKTQIKLLEQVSTVTNRVCVFTGHITTRRDRGYGKRDLEAALALVEAGKLRWVETFSGQDCLRNGGRDIWCVRTYELV
jgi:hypothetical protein